MQVLKAGEILLNNPHNEATHGVFDIMQAQWLDHVEKLREIIQAALDPVQFIRACGKSLLSFKTSHCDMKSWCSRGSSSGRNDEGRGHAD